MKQVFLHSLIMSIFIGFLGCEDPAESEDDTPSLVNTLGDNSLSNDGHYDSYFYDFTQAFNVKFYRYDKNSLKHSGLFNPDEDTLNFQNFKNYLLTIEPEDTQNRVWVPVSLADTALNIPITDHLYELYPSSTDPELLDSLFDAYETQGYAETVIYDTGSVYSQPFKNIESLIWNEYNEINVQFQNYSIKNTGYILDTMFVPHTDEVINRFYRTDVVGEDANSVIVDPTEWIDRVNEHSENDDILDASFEFSRTSLSSDSLIYRINTDCNDNGFRDDAEPFTDTNGNEKWDSGEPFTDLGNGIWDDAEPYVDLDENGENPLHGFQDRNCNDVWDDAEEIVDEGTEGSIYDEFHSLWFIDRGNGLWDDDEIVTQVAAYEETSYDELFKFGKISKNLLVSWEDPNTPRILEEIYPGEKYTDADNDGSYDPGEEFEDLNGNGDYDANGDSLVAKWPDLNGNPIVFRDIIQRYQYDVTTQKLVTNLDSVVMVWSHPVVGNADENSEQGGDYYITKTKWEYIDATEGFKREYDYHFFKKNEHIYKRVFPSHFLPYGFHGYSGADDGTFEGGFWFDSTRFVDQVLYYTPGNYFRDGERVGTAEDIITSIADYYIGKSYAVDRENVTLESSGRTYPADSTFKVTREVSMTMLGTGVEYIERNETWLVEGLGMVKDLVSFYWTDPPEWVGLTGEGWVEYSMLELAEYRENDSSGKLLFGNRRISHPNQLNNLDKFEDDPFKMKRTVGLQRIEFPVND